MKLYRTRNGILAEADGRTVRVPEPSWDRLLNRPDLGAFLADGMRAWPEIPGAFDPDAATDLLPPVGSQEVWAAGVTYLRSREARREESADAGGGDFYARVYEADRPELFYKAPPRNVVGHRRPIRVRRDAAWNVPEPELTLALNAAGRIVGYAVGNDVSSRDIEGENPLYLPQAKVYTASCALGPGLLVTDTPLPPETPVRLEVEREGKAAFAGETTLSRMKRTPEELAGWLFREMDFPEGCFLMTGTGIVPPAGLTLRAGDAVRIEIPPVGRLVNPVGAAPGA